MCYIKNRRKNKFIYNYANNIEPTLPTIIEIITKKIFIFLENGKVGELKRKKNNCDILGK